MPDDIAEQAAKSWDVPPELPYADELLTQMKSILDAENSPYAVLKK
jgi:hypothetical protein